MCAAHELVGTHTALPICLAHAVGGVMGFALVYKGASAVIWAGRTASFPYYTGEPERFYLE
jgi:hypothetical protein